MRFCSWVASLKGILPGMRRGCFLWCLVVVDRPVPCLVRSRGGSGNTFDVATAALL